VLTTTVMPWYQISQTETQAAKYGSSPFRCRTLRLHSRLASWLGCRHVPAFIKLQVGVVDRSCSPLSAALIGTRSDFVPSFESALAAVTTSGLNLTEFDGNNDGYVDLISVLHRYGLRLHPSVYPPGSTRCPSSHAAATGPSLAGTTRPGRTTRRVSSRRN
jgi:hypothetical protein